VLAKAQARDLPTLIELSSDSAPPSIPVYLVFHKELRNVPRYRVVTKELGGGTAAGVALTGRGVFVRQVHFKAHKREELRHPAMPPSPIR